MKDQTVNILSFTGHIEVSVTDSSPLPLLFLFLKNSLKMQKTLKIFLIYIYFERERKRERGWGGAEKRGNTESEAGSRPAVSTEPDMGLKLMT